MTERLKQTGEILIEAIAYGDAAGLPVETKSAEYIAQQYGYLDRLIAPVDNMYFQGDFDEGTWSDDTQLSMAVAVALVEADGFDMEAMLETHIEEYLRTPMVEVEGKQVRAGWGGSTTTSMERLIDGVSPFESGVSGFDGKGKPLGAGNGVLMKLAPLAYWHVARGVDEEERHSDYAMLTRMTHDTDVAVAATRLHGDVLQWLLQDGDSPDPTPELIEYINERSAVHRSFFGISEQEWGVDFGYLHPGLTAAEILEHTDGRGFYAPQTLAMAYGALIAHHAEYEESVYGAVNLGGDTDSVASIVGAMSVLGNVPLEFPEDIGLLDQRRRLQRVSKLLTNAALGGS